MFIWLPPSESKTPVDSGPALDLDSLSLPELADARREVARVLAEVSAHKDGSAVLGLGPAGAADARANTALFKAPCAPASRLFTGVLYDAADFPTLEGEAIKRARASVRIFSGLFGVLALDDLVPDHRLSMSVRLGDLGSMGAHWKSHLDAPLRAEAEGAFVLDMRSGPYAKACPAPWAHLLRVRVEREAEGARQVVSHDAKRWRGALTRALLVAGADDSSREALIDSVREATRGIVLVDASGREHRVIGVEVGPVKALGAGGSDAAATLVTN